jgi:hypothetical protein
MDGEGLMCLGFCFQSLDEAVEHSFGVAVYAGVFFVRATMKFKYSPPYKLSSISCVCNWSKSSLDAMDSA